MDKGRIPKKIHYIWFGNNPKSELIQRCINSWREFCPDYEIIEWNESNYDVNGCDYIREACVAGKWAFASDYARFDILYTHGGIYVDTDVELLKPLPEELLQHTAFTGYESNGNINPGLICGAIPGFSLNREIVETYRNMHFLQNGKPVMKTVNMVVGEILEKHTPLKRNELQTVEGLTIYPAAYFCGYDLDVGEYDIRPETISVHHYAGTWAAVTMKHRIQKLLKKLLGIPRYRKLLALKRKLFGISGAKHQPE